MDDTEDATKLVKSSLGRTQKSLNLYTWDCDAQVLFSKKSISQCNGEISHIVIGENQVALPEITTETLMWQILGTYLAS
jgi:hypothetical protein